MTDNDRALMTGQPLTTSLYFFYVKERNNMRMFIIFFTFAVQIRAFYVFKTSPNLDEQITNNLKT